MSVYKDHALSYFEKGYCPVPINLKSPTGKGPYVRGWESYSYDKMSREQLLAMAEKYPNSGIGLVMGHQVMEGFRILSVDVDDDDLQVDVRHAIGPYNVSKRGKKGETIFCRSAMSFSIGSKKLKRIGADGRKLPKPSVEILGLKTQTVVPPSIHPDTLKPYYWLLASLLDVDFMDLPEFTEGTMLELEAICASKNKWFQELNAMTWLGVGGGGDTHDICVSATAYLVAAGWKDDLIHRRIERAKKEACERAGEAYDWPQATKTIQEWIDSSKAKGHGDVKEKTAKKKETLERVAAAWAIDFLGGMDLVACDREGMLRRYTEGHWPEVNLELLKQTIYREMPEVSKRECENAVGIIHSVAYRPNFGRSVGLDLVDDPKRRKMCFINGTLDLMTSRLEKHDPEDEITHQINSEWDDHAECPNFDKFIDEMFRDDAKKKECVLQYMAYTLIPDTSFQKMLVLIGPGGNGKGTLCRFWSSVFDPAVVSTVAMNEIGNERYMSSLVGKMINISSEQSRFDSISDNAIKRITGQDPVTIRRLYQNPVNNVNLCVRLVMQVNTMPATSDSSDALRRRLMMIECSNKPLIPDTKLDAKLFKERVGVIRKHLLPALRSLYAANEFTVPESSKLMVAEYLKENDPVLMWLEDCCEIVEDEKSATMSRELFGHFAEWMKRCNYRYPISECTWGKQLTAKGLPSVNKWVPAHSTSYKVRKIKLKLGEEKPF